MRGKTHRLGIGIRRPDRPKTSTRAQLFAPITLPPDRVAINHFEPSPLTKGDSYVRD